MDQWDEGSDYERFMGRWSRQLALEFVTAMGSPQGLRCLDVGCGTGALVSAIGQRMAPARLVGVDQSDAYIDVARAHLAGQAELFVADGEELPFDDGSFDLVVSGLVLNFIPDPLAALREWKRVTRPGGQIRAYVWDYAEGMEFLRHFWDAAVALNPDARDLDEGVRFPICRPEPLQFLFDQAGMGEVSSGDVTVSTEFADFADYWEPFLSGQGPAPGYVSSLSEDERLRLRGNLEATLPRAHDGSIPLTARAWTVVGRT